MPALAIGVFLPTMSERGTPPGDIAAAARHAEGLGFDSVWAIDQLVGGTGVPLVDSTVALAVAAGATTRVGLGYGVMILPLHPPVWAAKQVASLQHVSGDRLTLGVGVGGDRHELSWTAAGVPRRERGRRTDEALALLPDLIAGKPATVGDASVTLSPGVTVPPVVVGGVSDAAFRRAAAHDGWFGLPLPPHQLAPLLERLGSAAADLGRPRPPVVGSVMTALDGDLDVPSPDDLVRRLSDPDGLFGMPADAAPDMVVTGSPAAAAERLAALGELGIDRTVVTLAAGSWHRQAELLAEAATQLR
jgi:alkanesulfonate monooxygenase SsuD/methylene tetrahydromethanopterin reductase-like flavin-dependent oxidoreductase (luciferase family)